MTRQGVQYPLTTTIRLSPEIRRWLHDHARQLGTTQSELIRAWIEEHRQGAQAGTR